MRSGEIRAEMKRLLRDRSVLGERTAVLYEDWVRERPAGSDRSLEAWMAACVRRIDCGVR